MFILEQQICGGKTDESRQARFLRYASPLVILCKPLQFSITWLWCFNLQLCEANFGHDTSAYLGSVWFLHKPSQSATAPTAVVEWLILADAQW
jgi:hypothetical protein